MLDLVKLGDIRTVAGPDMFGQEMFGIVSAGEFFAMAPADQLDQANQMGASGE